ncbi:hypothetical protein M3Y95_00713500 [Aphelenchoides besseyi]|nr:hypothetical protein M3Y95_00713500 [Aphelenchoides besseyi]
MDFTDLLVRINGLLAKRSIENERVFNALFDEVTVAVENAECALVTPPPAVQTPPPSYYECLTTMNFADLKVRVNGLLDRTSAMSEQIARMFPQLLEDACRLAEIELAAQAAAPSPPPPAQQSPPSFTISSSKQLAATSSWWWSWRKATSKSSS